MSNFHLVMACLISFVVSNFPEPMLTLPAMLVGAICVGCGYVLSKWDLQGEQIAQQNDEQE